MTEGAVASVVGVVLILAVIVGAYANAIRTDLPALGAASEREWSATVAQALGDFARALAGGLADGAPLSTLLQGPPSPRGIDVPLLGQAVPLAATGTIAFDPACSALTADHVIQEGPLVSDLNAGATGCLHFQAEPVYSSPFGYRVEAGGLLRVQADGAVVLAGPALDLDAGSPLAYRAALGAPGLRGEPTSTSLGSTSARIDLVPGPSVGEVEQSPNAASATWRIETAFPRAWRNWFDARFAHAGFQRERADPAPGESAADYAVFCVPADCATDALGRGVVEVRIEGPRLDANDLKLSVTYAVFDVNVH